ncbi:MAG: chorismate-binding protein, partial [Planctomycetota bacterium]|nr:chorismate-binding protein [Planctomycetota bacterium]
MPATFRFRPRVTVVPSEAPGADLAEALSRLRARRRLALLDGGGGRSRFSLLGFDPLATGSDPKNVPELRGFVGSLRRDGGDDVPFFPHFMGGFLGALAYDLGVVGETLDLPAEPWGQPLVVGGLYVDFLVRDHAVGTTWLVLGDEPGDGRPAVAERRAELFSLLQGPAPEAAEPLPLGPLVRHVSGDEHCARIERARGYIAAGDMYQANLAHRFTRRISGDPIDLYLRLRRLNPGPYMGFLRWGSSAAPGESPTVSGEEGALLSTSPELLLELDGNVARTQPIKGTAPR